MAIDLASPLVPGAFLLLACLGSLARAMVCTASGATHAALTQHFAARRGAAGGGGGGGGSAADLTAKADSRERAINIIGSIMGMGLTHVVAGAAGGGGRGLRPGPCAVCREDSNRITCSPTLHNPQTSRRSSCPDNALSAWVIFTVLTALHVWANVRAMRCLVLTTLNVPRLELLLQSHLERVRRVLFSCAELRIVRWCMRLGLLGAAKTNQN
jgi:hypothetical protein